MFKTYYYLTKPGIIYGNTLTAAAGFLLASRGNIDLILFIPTLTGLAFIIAPACVFNNILDRNIDQKMERTKYRSLATKSIPILNAFIFGLSLIILGIVILICFTNLITLAIALLGFVFYVFIYGFAKRISVHGTVVGSISGAVPPVVGYCAVTNRLDLTALLLFLILVLWQMPHFYAISIFRLNDYANANIPVLPVKTSVFVTKIYMLFYIIGFFILTVILGFIDSLSIIYLLPIIMSGFAWITLAIKGFYVIDSYKWARKMFFFSLIINLLFCLSIAIDSIF